MNGIMCHERVIIINKTLMLKNIYNLYLIDHTLSFEGDLEFRIKISMLALKLLTSKTNCIEWLY